MSDADKGIKSRSFELSMTMSQPEDRFVLSRCMKHLADNAKDKTKGTTMNRDQKRLIVDLAKARTRDMYLKRLAVIAKENRVWAQFLDGKQSEFAAYRFLDNGIRRFGKVTSNAVEIMNGALLQCREYPILYLVESIIKYQRDKYVEHYNQAIEWEKEGRLLTLYAQDEAQKTCTGASKRKVELLEHNYPIYRGRVSCSDFSNPFGYIEVSIDVETKEVKCPCRLFEEEALLCQHLQALLLSIDDVDWSVKEWIHYRYHLDTYKQSYSASVPAMTVRGLLQPDTTAVPPDFKKQPGRPATARKSRQFIRKTNQQRTCGACGSKGHFWTSCKAPSTEYRYTVNYNKALEWCQSIDVELS